MFYEVAFFQYLSQERRFSTHTLAAYRSDLTGFIQFCQDKQCLNSVAGLRHLHIRAWVVYRMETGDQPRSISRRLSCLKTYFQFLKKRGHIEKDPMKKVTPPRVGKALPVVLQESQLDALFTHLEFGDDYAGAQHRLILELLYATGIRRSEASALKWSDIDASRMIIRILGKGGKERFVPLPGYLLQLFEAFRTQHQAMFPSTDQPWIFMNRKAGRMSPESLYSVVRK
ncbi:MAG: site-specific integrase, partial [Saprospiraceae bacterium]|nr:site-specific integrase [Saprospiraceae bacterium]